MRELHVVALSEDGRHVVLATRAGTASGEFRVALDERLTAAVRGDLPAPGRDAPPSISPRDIQARLRDGEAPEEIAASAGVPLSRVERYAGPVLAELERMITGARAAVVSRPRLGTSALPLGEAVEVHLAEVAHLAEGSVRWSARRTDLGRWVVEVSWTARGRRRTAGWHYDPAAREVAAVDGPSAVLGHVEADAVPDPAGGRSARPAAAAPAARAAAAGTARSSAVAPAAAGRSARTAATSTSPRPRTADTGSSPQRTRPSAATDRASAAARTGTPPTNGPRTSSPRTAPTAPAPAPRRRAAATPPVAPPAAQRRSAAAAPATRRRATAAQPPAAAAVRQGPDLPVVGVDPAASAPAAPTSIRRTPARGAPADQRTGRGTAAPGEAAPRRAAARRSAVPPLEDLAARTSDIPVLEARTAGSAASPASPASPEPPRAAGTPPPAPSPSGPPVLRVVPPADPEPAPDPDDAVPATDPDGAVPAPDPDDAAPAPEARPVRRAAGQRAGGHDWADVLMGSAPPAPAAEPRQD